MIKRAFPNRQFVREQAFMLREFYSLSRALEMEITPAERSYIIEIQTAFCCYVVSNLKSEIDRLKDTYGGK